MIFFIPHNVSFMLFFIAFSYSVFSQPSYILDTTFKEKKVYSKVPTMPVPPFKNPFKEVHYPNYAAKNGISGKVEVKFIVNEDGSISDITVISKTDSSLNNEAIRLVKNSKQWQAGKLQFKPVKVSIVWPINFSLE